MNTKETKKENSLMSYPDPDFSMLKDLKINIEEVNTTHKLDNILGKKVNYKFGEIKLNYDIQQTVVGTNNNWKETLLKLITLELKNGILYSLAILGYYQKETDTKIVTYGKHLLITKEIKFEALSTYIQGQIDLLNLSLESDSTQGFEDIAPIIIFKYREISVLIENWNKDSRSLNVFKENLNSNVDNTQKLSKNLIKFLNVIPLTSDFSQYGFNLGDKEIKGIKGQMFKYSHEITIFIYNKTDLSYSGTIFKNNHEYLTFQDTIIKEENLPDNSFGETESPCDLETAGVTKNKLSDNCIANVKKDYNLIRTLGKNKVYIKNSKNTNEIVFVETTLLTKKIQKVKRELIRDEKYLSFDIECYLNSKNEFTPFSCKWYHPKKNKEYFVTDYSSWEEMINTCVFDLFKSFPNYTIYVHNLSSFDSLFLLKIFYRNYNCKVKFKENRAIEIKINTKNRENLIKSNLRSDVRLTFKDSLMLLPLSLDKLIKAFKVPIKKLSFPYLFIKKLEDLNYIGKIPDFSFYKNLSYEEYVKLSLNYTEKTPWSFKEENSKYLHNDVKALYLIIDTFSKEVYSLERINITKIISISSLALKTYLANYYDEERAPIHIPHYNQYNDIKKAYYGGRVEVFKSYGENLYHYDFVSLYPYIMKQILPQGNLIKSTDTCLDNYFGFCYATVTVPENTYNSILPFRDENNNVYNPTGTWTAWFPSVLLQTARKVDGTLISVHFGYKLSKGNELFKNYVDKYFNVKNESENNPGRRFLAKLMLNSLYGRFGLNYFKATTKLVNSEEALKIFKTYKVLENEVFDKETGLEYISYTKEPSDILKDLNFANYLNLKNESENNQITRSIYIAAMVTALAATTMYKFLDLYKDNIYYSDTDSLILDVPLDPQFIGENIGKFKYVNKVKRGYFIAPKLYLLVLENDVNIIKSKGINKEFLNEKNFIELLHGIPQNISVKRFSVNLIRSSVAYVDSHLKIEPNLLKREPIYKNGIVVNTKPLRVIEGKIVRGAPSLVTEDWGESTKVRSSIVKYEPQNFKILKRDSNLFSHLQNKKIICAVSGFTLNNKLFELLKIIYPPKGKELSKLNKIIFKNFLGVNSYQNNKILEVINLYLIELKELEPIRPSLNFYSFNHNIVVKSKLAFSYMSKGNLILENLLKFLKNLSLFSLIRIFLEYGNLNIDYLFKDNKSNLYNLKANPSRLATYGCGAKVSKKFIIISIIKYDFELIISLKLEKKKEFKVKTVFYHKVVYEINLINPIIKNKFKDFIKLNKQSKVLKKNKPRFNSIGVLKHTEYIKTVLPLPSEVENKITNFKPLIIQKIISN